MPLQVPSAREFFYLRTFTLQDFLLPEARIPRNRKTSTRLFENPHGHHALACLY